GNRRDKPIIEYDPEIEKTLTKNRNRVKAQRALGGFWVLLSCLATPRRRPPRLGMKLH
ncbi:hypothetical protein PIB30_100334, partial [Stylosanthes scabra]|nr:hypothetical protein [Stylosanthes scabra]